MNTDIFKFLSDVAAAFPPNRLLWAAWGSFAAVFAVAIVLCFALPAVRSASKRPFLCLVYAYTAVTFAIFLTCASLENAAFAAAVFWLAGYLMYGILCAVTRKKPASAPAQIAACNAPLPVISAVPVQGGEKPKKPPAPMPAVRNNVRLEHAIAVTESLLQKNLGKSDRQELEKLKNTLEVLKVKGNLSPAEGEILNDNFNMLLKLMAKYNA